MERTPWLLSLFMVASCAEGSTPTERRSSSPERSSAARGAGSLASTPPLTPFGELPPPPTSQPAAPTSSALATAASRWDYEEQADDMSVRSTMHARLSSAEPVSLDFPYDGMQFAFLRLRHGPDGREVIVGVPRGQIDCSMRCDVLVRFDDGEPRRWRAAPAASGIDNIIFLDEFDTFTAAMLDASRVRVRLAFYGSGSRTLEFNVAGYDHERLEPVANLRARLRRATDSDRARRENQQSTRERAQRQREIDDILRRSTR